MLANLHRHISLSTIASQVGISPRHLNRSFHLHLRTSCAAWLIAQRMQLARRLLRSDATVPIKTVAYRCGFSRPAFFAKTYKTHWGVSPSGSRRA
jgi:transcriptional regulator GlxA family with amidase domain